MINTQYISSGGGSPMANVVKKHSISSELAQNMVDEAVAKAREIGVRENVAILDDGGNPLLPGPGGGPARRLAPLPEGAEPRRLRRPAAPHLRRDAGTPVPPPMGPPPATPFMMAILRPQEVVVQLGDGPAHHTQRAADTRGQP